MPKFIPKADGPKLTRMQLLKQGLYSGIGWSIGATLGFAIVSTIVVFGFNMLGGLPLIGGFVANVVKETQVQLGARNPNSPLNSANRTPTSTKVPTPTLELTPTSEVIQ
jgi:hypothetical protein